MDAQVWAASSTIRVGDYHVGVRSSTVAADALLRRVLSAHVVDDPDAPANLSVQLHPPSPNGGPADPLHRLYDGHREVARDRDPTRVLRGLVGCLSRFAPPDPGVLRLRALAVAGPEGAVLLPAAWRSRAPELDRRVRRAGLSVIDAPHAWLDVRSGEVVAPQAVHVDAAALADVAQVAASPRRIAAPPPPGPHPLRGWVLPAAADGQARSRAGALVTAMGLVRNLEAVGGQRALHALAGRLHAIEVVTAPVELTDAGAAVLAAELVAGA